MNWKEIAVQHTAAQDNLAEVEPPQRELDADTEAMFAASDAEDARKQAEAWEKTDPDYNPHLDAEAERGDFEAGE